MITKNQHTLRVWHGTLEAFEVFLHRKTDRVDPEVVTLYAPKNRRFHVWAYGVIAADVAEALGLTKLKSIVLGAAATTWP